MNRTMRPGAGAAALLVLGFGAGADEYAIEWSVSTEAVVKDFAVPEDDDDVTGFFDRYEYTSGKGYQFPVQIGIADLDLDLLGAQDTPLLQFRFQSPTSNLSLTGSNATPFLNQRADLSIQPEGLDVDVDYRRMRSDEIRLFPNPSDIGADIGSQYNDDTGASDRFFTRRTGVDGRVRLRLAELFEGTPAPLADLLPELSIRGGYQKRDGQRQARYLLDDGESATPASRWRGRSAELDQRASDVGAGVVLTPGGLFSMALDLDVEQFRENAPLVLRSDIPDPAVFAGQSTLQFVPDTDRITGTMRLNRRFGDRALIHGGFQGVNLEQVGDFTPNQLGAGLRKNAIRFYSASAGADVALAQALSANAFFKYDLRDNRIQRDTALFNPDTGDPNQVAPFLEMLESIEAGAELALSPRPARLAAIGFRGEWVDRDLDFAEPPNLVILPTNTVIHSETEAYAGYLRGRLRPARGLDLSGEAGYRYAPETGYIRELARAVYFDVRGAYSVPISRPLDLSLFGRGEFGENGDFRQRSESPAAPDPDRDFERNNYSFGLTATFVPAKPLTLFASGAHHRDAQMFDLVRSNFPRYFEPLGAAVDFFRDNPLDYRAVLTNALVGGSYRLSERTETTLSYSYTRSDARIDPDNATASTLQPWSRILSSIHSLDARVGHWFADGLRAYLGYRFDDYVDDSRAPAGTDSAAAAFDLSTTQHTFTAGVTLTGALLERR